MNGYHGYLYGHKFFLLYCVIIFPFSISRHDVFFHKNLGYQRPTLTNCCSIGAGASSFFYIQGVYAFSIHKSLIYITPQASTLTFVRLSCTSENWRRTSRSCITVARRDKWKNNCPTFWMLFSIIKLCCFVIFTDYSFINNYFNVCKNIGFYWSTLSPITAVNQEIFRTYTWSVSFQRFE